MMFGLSVMSYTQKETLLSQPWMHYIYHLRGQTLKRLILISSLWVQYRNLAYV